MTETNSDRRRASRYKRLEKPRPMRLTERDKQVIKAVNDFRMLRQDQVQRLFFPSRNTAQVRLWLLWQHGFLKREFMPVLGGIQTSPVLYVLNSRGAELLRTEFGYDDGQLRWSPRKGVGYRYVEHTLGLSEIRVSVVLSCRRHKYTIKTWVDERGMKSDYDSVKVGKGQVAVIPDSYFVIGLPVGDIHFFLEFDRGPERLQVFKKKVAAYTAYYGSGKCRARYGTSKIRVLTVTEHSHVRGGPSRMNNLRQVTEELGGHQRFWFSNLDQVTKDDFFIEPIWWQAMKAEPAALFASNLR